MPAPRHLLGNMPVGFHEDNKENRQPETAAPPGSSLEENSGIFCRDPIISGSHHANIIDNTSSNRIDGYKVDSWKPKIIERLEPTRARYDLRKKVERRLADSTMPGKNVAKILRRKARENCAKKKVLSAKEREVGESRISCL